jgi:hypothetical protein
VPTLKKIVTDVKGYFYTLSDVKTLRVTTSVTCVNRMSTKYQCIACANRTRKVRTAAGERLHCEQRADEEPPLSDIMTSGRPMRRKVAAARRVGRRAESRDSGCDEILVPFRCLSPILLRDDDT